AGGGTDSDVGGIQGGGGGTSNTGCGDGVGGAVDSESVACGGGGGQGLVHVEGVQTQSLRGDLFQVDGDLFAVVGANLDVEGLVFRQYFYAVEIGFGGDAVDLGQA